MSAHPQRNETSPASPRTKTRTEDADFSAESDGYDLGIATANTPKSIEQPPELGPSIPFDGYVKHYEIIRKLGRGGMGVVLLARDTKLGRLVAIKLLHSQGQAVVRILAEAQATARCRHENIVVIHDVDEVDGQPYIVLEYLEGRTLREVIASIPDDAHRALPEPLVLDIVTAVVEALAVAHKEKVVHRDLKPENIMMLENGQIKLLDFGIAWRTDKPAQRARQGTLAYMAPEQWLGTEIDARTDLWAVGVLFYELLTGAHPLVSSLRRSQPEELVTVADVTTPMPRLYDVRPDLEGISQIVERCLAKRKEDRFSSAEELLAALEPWRNAGKNAMFAGTSPFAGLAAFQEADAGRFFGRDADIASLMGKLRRQRFIAVTGPSGAGKSSFVRAGIIPTLKRTGDTWGVLIVRPGRAPLSALIEALGSEVFHGEPLPRLDLRAEPGGFGARLRAHCRTQGGGHRVLVFVDQFEELYTLVSDPEEQSAFLQCLLGAADEASLPVRVVLCIRSDFLDRVAEDRFFMSEVSQGLFFLPPVGREGLREALVRPVEAAGHRFEDDAMVQEILEDLDRTKTPLPILQFAAAALWENRDTLQKQVTMVSYEAMGGVVGSLSTHADAVFAGLSLADQRLCQAMFLRLVTPERTRAIVHLADLSSLAAEPLAAETLIQHLCGARLLLLENAGDHGAVTVEIVHESLIERWPKLARWLDESTAEARFLARLRAATLQWEAGGEVDGLLWRDRVAEEACDWFERRKADLDTGRGLLLTPKEERYLRSVVDHFHRARRMRQRGIIGAFAFLSAVSGLVFFLAMRAQSHAERADTEANHVKEQNAELAFQAQRGRNAMRLLAARKRPDDPTLVLSLLREVEPGDTPKDWSELVYAALSHGVAAATANPHGPFIVYSAFVSPDGRAIVTTSSDKTARVSSFDGLHEMAVLRGHEADVWRAAWSPDGKRIATVSVDHTVRIFQADGTGQPLVLQHGGPVGSAAWSPDGAFVVTGADDKLVRVFRSKDGAIVTSIPHDSEVYDTQFSPDGQRIVTASQDGIGRIWNANGQGAPTLLRGHQGYVCTATFRPDGKRIATTGEDRTARIWDAASGQEILVLRGHEDKVMNASWSPDGKLLATASKDKTVRVFRGDGWGDPMILRGHAHWAYTVDFSPDGHHLVSASLDRSIRVWDLNNIGTPTAMKGFPLVFRRDPRGTRAALGASDGQIRLWNVNEPSAVIVLRGHTARIRELEFSPDGAYIVSSGDTTARIWRTNDVTEPLLRVQHTDTVDAVHFNRRGDRIVSASLDGKTMVSRVDGAGEPLVFQSPAKSGPYVFAFLDPSDEHLVTASDGDKSIWVWKLDAPERPVELLGHEKNITWVRASPDGTRFASSSEDGTARIWSFDETRQPIVLRHDGAVRSIAWSPDGAYVVTASDDRTARVFSADGSGEPVILRGHEDVVNQAAFSPDGQRIATASSDRTARVFRIDGRAEPVVLGGADVRLTHAFWSPDGKRFVTQADNGVQHLFPDAIPFVGPEDPRLWNVSTYCMPTKMRMALLGNTEKDALTDYNSCLRRVEAARSAPDKPLDSFRARRADGQP